MSVSNKLPTYPHVSLMSGMVVSSEFIPRLILISQKYNKHAIGGGGGKMVRLLNRFKQWAAGDRAGLCRR